MIITRYLSICIKHVQICGSFSTLLYSGLWECEGIVVRTWATWGSSKDNQRLFLNQLGSLFIFRWRFFLVDPKSISGRIGNLLDNVWILFSITVTMTFAENRRTYYNFKVHVWYPLRVSRSPRIRMSHNSAAARPCMVIEFDMEFAAQAASHCAVLSRVHMQETHTFS